MVLDRRAASFCLFFFFFFERISIIAHDLQNKSICFVGFALQIKKRVTEPFGWHEHTKMGFSSPSFQRVADKALSTRQVVEQCWPIISCKSAKPLQSIARNNEIPVANKIHEKKEAKPSFVVASQAERRRNWESSECALRTRKKWNSWLWLIIIWK